MNRCTYSTRSGFSHQNASPLERLALCGLECSHPKIGDRLK